MALALSKVSKNVPAHIYQGASVAVRRKFDNYPVATWSAFLVFTSHEGAHRKIDATTEGGYFRFETTAFEGEGSNDILGRCDWLIEVTDGTDSFVAARGETYVWPNPDVPSGADAGSHDFRTNTQKMLDMIALVLVGGAITDDVSSYTISTAQGTRSLSRIPRSELLDIERDLKARRREELSDMRNMSGKRRGNRVLSRSGRGDS